MATKVFKAAEAWLSVRVNVKGNYSVKGNTLPYTYPETGKGTYHVTIGDWYADISPRICICLDVALQYINQSID